MKRIILFVIVILILSGCSKVKHIDQLLTLKGLADEQEQMNQYIQDQDQKFELMLKEMKEGRLDQYLSKGKIVRAFGDPVFIKSIKNNNQEVESWLYRYATQYFNSEKIYLYFDEDEKLVRYEYVVEQRGENQKEEARKENGKIR